MSSTILPLEPKKLKKLSDEELGAMLHLVKGNTTLPTPAFPHPPAIGRDGSAPMSLRLRGIQQYIKSLEYNHTGTSYYKLRRDRGLQHVILTAKEIVREALPIQCVEAVFVATHLTTGMADLLRIPISFKSTADGNTYRHIVLAVRYGDKWGALGISRRDSLMWKDLQFSSLAELIKVVQYQPRPDRRLRRCRRHCQSQSQSRHRHRHHHYHGPPPPPTPPTPPPPPTPTTTTTRPIKNFEKSYAACLHELVKVYLGLPFLHESVYSDTPIKWRAVKLSLGGRPWDELSVLMRKFEREAPAMAEYLIRSGELPADWSASFEEFKPKKAAKKAKKGKKRGGSKSPSKGVKGKSATKAASSDEAAAEADEDEDEEEEEADETDGAGDSDAAPTAAAATADSDSDSDGGGPTPATPTRPTPSARAPKGRLMGV